MGINKKHGFTVIEVMLFLAVTGTLAVAVLVGSGVSIGQQRYRDSVNSLKSFIQEQYGESTRVINSRNASWTCDSLGGVIENPLGVGQPRGSSDCVLLGRFITINELGTSVAASSVVGYHIAGAPTAPSDIEELQDNYQLGISPIDREEVVIGWGAQAVKSGTDVPMPLSFLIVRSPLSGSVMTFVMDGVKTNPSELITPSNLDKTTNICLKADAGSFVGKRLAIQISAFASNQAAVQIPSEGVGLCG